MKFFVEFEGDKKNPKWEVIEYGDDSKRLEVDSFEELKGLRDEVDSAIKEYENTEQKDGVLSSKEVKKIFDWIEQYEFGCQICNSNSWSVTDKVLAIISTDKKTGVRTIVLTCTSCGNQMFFSADRVGI